MILSKQPWPKFTPCWRPTSFSNASVKPPLPSPAENPARLLPAPSITDKPLLAWLNPWPGLVPWIPMWFWEAESLSYCSSNCWKVKHSFQHCCGGVLLPSCSFPAQTYQDKQERKQATGCLTSRSLVLTAVRQSDNGLLLPPELVVTHYSATSTESGGLGRAGFSLWNLTIPGLAYIIHLSWPKGITQGCDKCHALCDIIKLT